MEFVDLIQNPAFLACVGLTMLAVVVVRMRKRSRSMDAARRNSGDSGSGSRPNGPTLRDVHDVARELNDLLAELQETARRIAAQIDNRYAKLDAMLAEADARIRRLEQLNGQGGSVAEHGVTGSTEPQALSTAPAVPSTPPPAALVDPKYKPIYELADKGKTPREIAQQLGAQPGEVELILNLRGSHS